MEVLEFLVLGAGDTELRRKQPSDLMAFSLPMGLHPPSCQFRATPIQCDLL